MPAPEPAPPRRHHPWEPPEAEFPGIVPIDTLLLGRTDQVAVAVIGLSAFSAGMEIFLTARIRPSDGHPEEHLPGGPRDLAASRRSFRFGLQVSDGGRAGSPGGGRPGHDSEPAGPVLYAFGGGGPHLFVSRWWTWPLPPAGPLEFACEWPAFGIAESRAGIDAQLILDAARRSIRLWPETKAEGRDPGAWVRLRGAGDVNKNDPNDARSVAVAALARLRCAGICQQAPCKYSALAMPRSAGVREAIWPPPNR